MHTCHVDLHQANTCITACVLLHLGYLCKTVIGTYLTTEFENWVSLDSQ